MADDDDLDALLDDAFDAVEAAQEDELYADTHLCHTPHGCP